jgi:hypothetical protein
VATIALIGFALSMVDYTMSGMLTVGTNKPIWPSRRGKSGLAFFLCSIFFQKINDFKAFLELDLVYRHDIPPKLYITYV